MTKLHPYGDDAFLGYGAVIPPNVRFGRGAVIGANAVTKDVPDFGVAAGSPAVLMEVYDHKRSAGSRLHGGRMSRDGYIEVEILIIGKMGEPRLE